MFTTQANPYRQAVAQFQAHIPDRSDAVALEAYKNAVLYFERELSAEPNRGRVWIHQSSTIDDVHEIVQQAQEKYDSLYGTTSAVREHINAFASSLIYYAGVFDVLVAADPAHAGLAWGAIKFLFSAVLNHSQLVTELTKALTAIGFALPRIKIDLTLYETPLVRDAVEHLYAHTLLFLQQAVTWYNASPARGVVKSFFKPFSLSFQGVVADVNTWSRTVEARAGTDGRQELRGMNTRLERQLQLQRHMEQRLKDMQQQMNDVHAVLTRVLQVATNNQSLLQSSSFNAASYPDALCGTAYVRISKTTHPFTSSLGRYQEWRQGARDTPLILHRLQTWAFIEESSTLLVTVGSRAGSRVKGVVNEVTQILDSSNHRVLWYISDTARASGTPPTVTSVLKSLISQVITSNPAVLLQDLSLRNGDALREPHSNSEWASLATLLLIRMGSCFVIIETEDLYRGRRPEVETRTLYETMSSIFNDVSRTKGVILKMLLVAYGSPGLSTSITASPCMTLTINAPPPVSRRPQRPRKEPLRIGDGKGSIQPRLISRYPGTASGVIYNGHPIDWALLG